MKDYEWLMLTRMREKLILGRQRNVTMTMISFLFLTSTILHQSLLCAGSCLFSEGCAVTEQEIRSETVLVYRKVDGVFKPKCETIYFPRHKDCECQVE